MADLRYGGPLLWRAIFRYGGTSLLRAVTEISTQYMQYTSIIRARVTIRWLG